MKWVFLGPPGAGKGTQAKRVAAEFDVAHVSTGDLLRSEVAAKSELGKAAESFMTGGGLVPDDLVIAMVAQKLDDLNAYLLDGFPRTLPQAQALLERVGDGAIDRVFSFELPDDEVLRRLGGRRTCRDCGTMYHVDFVPPQVEGKCDRCGGELFRRDDDEADAIRRRIDVFKSEAGPLIDFYGADVVTVDASRSPDEVFAEVRSYAQG